MAASLPAALGGRWRPSARVLARVGRRTIIESLYLLTAPVTAVAGLLLVLGGLGLGMAGLLLPARGRPPVMARALALARWSAGLERWRIAKVRAAAAVGAGSRGLRQRPGPPEAGPELWFVAAHAVLVLPVALITSVLTGLWWSVGVATFPQAAAT